MNKNAELYTWAVNELKSKGITDTKFTHEVILRVTDLYCDAMSENDIKKAVAIMIDEYNRCKIPSKQTKPTSNILGPNDVNAQITANIIKYVQDNGGIKGCVEGCSMTDRILYSLQIMDELILDYDKEYILMALKTSSPVTITETLAANIQENGEIFKYISDEIVLTCLKSVLNYKISDYINTIKPNYSEMLSNDGVDNSECRNGIKHENCNTLKMLNLIDEFDTRLSEVKIKNDILRLTCEGLSIDETAEEVFGLLSKNIKESCSCNGVCLKSSIIETIKESIKKLLDDRNKTDNEILETAMQKVISKMEESMEISKYFGIPVITAEQHPTDSNTIDMSSQKKNYNGPNYTSGNVVRTPEIDKSHGTQITELDCMRTNHCLPLRQKNIKDELIKFATALIKEKFEDMNGTNTKYISFVADYVESRIMSKYMLTYRCDFKCMKKDIRKAIETAICDRISENNKIPKYKEYIKIMQSRYEMLPENCGVITLLSLFSEFNDAIADEIYNDENIQKAIYLLLVDHYGDRYVEVGIGLFTDTPFISMEEFVSKLSDVLGLKSILE